jgi:hypothetical protein
LVAGEVADGVGTADVQRLGGTQGGAGRGAGGDGGFEVEGVGDVELGLHHHRAGERDQLLEDRDVPLVPGCFGEALDLVGHEPSDRLVDQPVQLGRLQLVSHRGEVPVHIVRSLW